MNVQELIKKYKGLEGVWGAPGAEIARRIFLQDLQQLDEPGEVKIPQVIAEYIEQKKYDDYHLLGAMIEIRSHKNKEINEWFEDDDNMELFARAWLDGYEVEKEKRYVVSLKNGQPLIKSQSGSALYFSQDITAGNYKITRKELEDAGFGWVFDCPGIEIEEVTD